MYKEEGGLFRAVQVEPVRREPHRTGKRSPFSPPAEGFQPEGIALPSVLPSDVFRIEAEIAEIEAALGDPTLYAKESARAAALAARLTPAREELDAAETRWLELSE